MNREYGMNKAPESKHRPMECVRPYRAYARTRLNVQPGVQRVSYFSSVKSRSWAATWHSGS